MKNIKDWLDVEFKSSSMPTEQFSLFSREIKKVLKKTLSDYELASWNRGHFEFSCFFKKDGKYIYISSSDVRHFKNEWYNKLLIRTAEDDKDYTGGSNNFSTLENIKEMTDSLLSR